MATVKIDPQRAAAEQILLYCGVPLKAIHQKMTNWDFTHNRLSSEIRLINDAIHGPVKLTPLLYQIINTSEFHRLKDIKQLGAANYVYPGANHTRFDHSIGVCYLAGEFARSLKQKMEEDVKNIPDEEKHLWVFTEEEILCTQIAGLCHDLGHGPFSHMFEHKVMHKLDVPGLLHHEQLSVAIFKHLLAENENVLFEFVKAKLNIDAVKKIEKMIHPTAHDSDSTISDKRFFLYEIVANKQSGVDVDKWDYYTRDCYYLGVSHDFQWRRCLLLGRVIMANGQLRIGFRDKELNNLYGMFRIRCHLHQIAYQHKTSKAIEKMLSDAILLTKDMPIIGIRSKVVDIETALLDAFKSVEDETEGSKLEGYLALTDSIVSIIKSALYHEAHTIKHPSDNHVKALKLLERIERRDLYYLSARTRVALQCDAAAGACSKAMYEELKDKQTLLDRIYSYCTPDSTIKKGDLWIEIVKFKPSSELTDDPIKEILFYEKSTGTSLVPLSLDMASQLMVSQVFIEYEVRIYDKRVASVRQFEDSEILQRAVNQWRHKHFIK